VTVYHAIAPGAISNARIHVEAINQKDRIARIKIMKTRIANYFNAHRKGVL
jgi:hypothetical protein